jgi:putative transcriptional regulator
MDTAKVDAATEQDIRRQMIEDGEDSDEPVDESRWYPGVDGLRRHLGFSQEEFVQAIRVPLATVQDWEAHRVELDPAAKSLL